MVCVCWVLMVLSITHPHRNSSPPPFHSNRLVGLTVISSVKRLVTERSGKSECVFLGVINL